MVPCSEYCSSAYINTSFYHFSSLINPWIELVQWHKPLLIVNIVNAFCSFIKFLNIDVLKLTTEILKGPVWHIAEMMWASRNPSLFLAPCSSIVHWELSSLEFHVSLGIYFYLCQGENQSISSPFPPFSPMHLNESGTILKYGR